ncbi:hypothetical protein DICA3_C16006 [Diutina catenulata]
MNDDRGPAAAKRTRASGEVLDYLLQEFDHNHNPSPDHRKHMASRTGMSEKAVRIWFQNRRAKLRKVEKMKAQAGAAPGSAPLSSSAYGALSAPSSFGAGSAPGSAPALASAHPSPPQPGAATPPGTAVDINSKYCLIDCSSLSVGSWQRVKSGHHDVDRMRRQFVNLSPFTVHSMMDSVDLLVILSKKNYEINYFFSAITNNAKILFRIFYPVSSIVGASLLNNGVSENHAELRVTLSAQPKFSVFFFNRAHSSSNQWSICDDFSEGQQVSSAVAGGTDVPHVLVGARSSLLHLNSFVSENQVGTEVPPVPVPVPKYAPPVYLDHGDAAPSEVGTFQFWDSAGAGPHDKQSASAPPSTTNATQATSASPPAVLAGSASELALGAELATMGHGPELATLGYSPMLPMDDTISPASAGSGPVHASPATPDFFAFGDLDPRRGSESPSTAANPGDPSASYTHQSMGGQSESGYPVDGGLELEFGPLDRGPVLEGPQPSMDSFIDYGGY